MDLTWFQEEGRNLKLSHWGGLEKVKLFTVLREKLTGQGLGGEVLEEIAIPMRACRRGALFTEV